MHDFPNFVFSLLLSVIAIDSSRNIFVDLIYLNVDTCDFVHPTYMLFLFSYKAI